MMMNAVTVTASKKIATSNMLMDITRSFVSSFRCIMSKEADGETCKSNDVAGNSNTCVIQFLVQWNEEEQR